MAGAKAIERRLNYSTGQVARICGVAPRTAGKWFDSGRLPGWRIPGGRHEHRRVGHGALMAFLRAHKSPIPAELEGEADAPQR